MLDSKHNMLDRNTSFRKQIFEEEKIKSFEKDRREFFEKLLKIEEKSF